MRILPKTRPSRGSDAETVGVPAHRRDCPWLLFDGPPVNTKASFVYERPPTFKIILRTPGIVPFALLDEQLT